MRTRSASSADGFRLLGAVLLALFVCWGVWASFNSGPIGPNISFHFGPNSKPTGDPEADAADALNNLNCGNRLRCDPRDPTFYDDPTLRYSIEKPMRDWDRKRKQWLKSHPAYAVGLEDRILVVSGSQPSECPHPKGDHMMLRFFKNKVDYCRRHGYDIFYNQALLHPSMGGCWAKIQTIRSAMLAHPEAEWVFWVDSDAAFTDMDFEVPLERYRAHNLVVHGWAHLIYEQRSWVSINAGVFLLRNCQWAMELLDEWAKMGPQTGHYDEWGKIQTATFKDKPFPEADDQSGLVYMLLKHRERWGEKTCIENEYALHGYWIGIVDRLENITRRYEATARARLRRRHAESVSEHYGELWDPQLEDGWRRPFVTHFTGCQPCTGKHSSEYEGNKCWDGMKMALNFADNQVLSNYGFVHRDLLDSAVVPAATTRFYDEDEF